MKNIFLFLLCCISPLVKGQVLFQKSYGGYSNDFPHDIIKTNDGGFIFVAEKLDSLGTIYIVKTDFGGDTIWTRLFGAYGDKPNSIEQTRDGGYLIAGGIYNQTLQHTCAFLSKIDSVGNIIWLKQFSGGFPGEQAYSAKELSNGEIIATGITSINGSTQQQDIFLMKADSAGNEIWFKNYGGTDSDFGVDVIEVYNGFIVYGETKGTNYPNGICIIKFDFSGNILWSSICGNGFLYYDDLQSFKKTSDGGFIALGGNSGPFLEKLDSLGNPTWTAFYSYPINSYRGNSVFQSTDDGFIITGAGGGKLFLIKTDSLANTMWAKFYADTTILEFTEGVTVLQGTDQGYIVIGACRTLGNLDSDILILKIDSSGHSSCNEENFSPTVTFNNSPSLIVPTFNTFSHSINTYAPSINFISTGNVTDICLPVNINSQQIENPNYKISLTPNPFHNTATLKLRNENSEIKSCELKIYNAIGIFIRTEKISDPHSYTLHRNNLNDGMYFYEVLNSNHEQIGTGKFIVE